MAIMLSALLITVAEIIVLVVLEVPIVNGQNQR